MRELPVLQLDTLFHTKWVDMYDTLDVYPMDMSLFQKSEPGIYTGSVFISSGYIMERRL
jgi:hypothetical protein